MSLAYLGLLTIIIALYILWQIRQLLLLVFTAVVLATALNQLVTQFQQWKIRRDVAIGLSITILLLIFILFFWIIVPPFSEQFEQLLDLLPTSLVEIQELLERLENTFIGENLVNFTNINNWFEQIQPYLNQLLERSFSLFTSSIAVTLQLLLVLVLTLMFLLDPTPYRQTFIRLFPSFYRHRVNKILFRCQESLGSWTMGILIEMVFIAALSGIGLWILQVRLPLAHAILTGLLNFIPNLGPTLSVFFPMAVALLDAPWKAGAVLVLYIVIQQIESYWLTPTIMAKQVSLLPAITLTSQLFFANFLGFLGLLMALPLTIVAKTWLEEVLFKDILDNWK